MTPSNKRPASLAEAVERAHAGHTPFDLAVREFLDSFYLGPATRSDSIQDRPRLLGGAHDPYVAAVAEHLARCHSLAIPDWTEHHGEDLREPVFAGGLESLKARLIVESPLAFRRRLIFVGHDALHRPHHVEDST